MKEKLLNNHCMTLGLFGFVTFTTAALFVYLFLWLVTFFTVI